MMWLQRIGAVMSKEVRQLARDRLTFGMIVGIPLMQICLFGYAINTDVRHLAGGVADLAGTSLSRRLVTDVQATQVVDFEMQTTGVDALLEAMRAGRIKVGLYIPPDFERRIAGGDRAAAQLLVDGSDPTIVGVAAALRNMRFDARGGAAGLETMPIDVRNYYNPERRSAVQIVPALIGVILTLTMVLFTAVAIVRERERGNFELLITTPVRDAELMVGKIAPYIMIGLIQVTIVLTVGVLLFDAPVNGRIVDLYVASLVFIAATLGLGLTISTLAQSQFQSMQLTLFVFLPSILLSGFLFPFAGMPVVAQWIGYVLPLTHFIELIRGIMLRGADLAELWPSVRSLLIFFVLAMTIAILRFRKRLD